MLWLNCNQHIDTQFFLQYDSSYSLIAKGVLKKILSIPGLTPNTKLTQHHLNKKTHFKSTLKMRFDSHVATLNIL